MDKNKHDEHISKADLVLAETMEEVANAVTRISEKLTSLNAEVMEMKQWAEKITH